MDSTQHARATELRRLIAAAEEERLTKQTEADIDLFIMTVGLPLLFWKSELKCLEGMQ